MGLCVIACFGLGGWDISDRFEQAPVVEPVDPFEGGEFHCLDAAPGGAAMDQLGLEQAIDGFGERVDAPISVKVYRTTRSRASATGRDIRRSRERYSA
jgi:hypothetical protein